MYTRELSPSFAGIPTFLRARRATTRQLKAGTVTVLGAPQDFTSSARPGARLGPKAIRDASVDFVYDLQASPSHTLVDIETGRRLRLPAEGKLVDLGDATLYPMSVARSMSSLRNLAAQVVRRGALPVALGGDAFVTYPLVQGVARGLSGKTLGYIQVSSQLNLGDADATWGKNWHGATARRIHEAAVVQPRNMAFIGTAGYISAEEWELGKRLGMTVIPARAVRSDGVDQAARRAQEAAGRGCDAIYLSVDIGAVDVGYAAGRGDAVIGGITPVDLLELMRAFSAATKICAMDFVEVAPTVDPSGRAQRLAAEAIIEFIGPRALA